MILVRTNVLIDLESGGEWARRIAELAFARALFSDVVAVNDVIFSEYSIGFESADACNRQLSAFGVAREGIPDDALHLAARAYLAYRRRGGMRQGTLPDFFIGAHAQVAGMDLLTRDSGRYAT